jgi:uncharacterized membrane protein
MTDMITKSIIIKAPVSRTYELWANFDNFPNFMSNIKSVVKTGDKTSHWVMEGPLGKDLEWDAQTTDIQQNKRIAWNSIRGDIKTSGAVTFSELAHEETQVTVMLHYVPPAGKLGDAVAHIFDNPEKKLEEDLKKFKRYAETKVTLP